MAEKEERLARRGNQFNSLTAPLRLLRRAAPGCIEVEFYLAPSHQPINNSILSTLCPNHLQRTASLSHSTLHSGRVCSCS